MVMRPPPPARPPPPPGMSIDAPGTPQYVRPPPPGSPRQEHPPPPQGPVVIGQPMAEPQTRVTWQYPDAVLERKPPPPKPQMPYIPTIARALIEEHKFSPRQVDNYFRANFGGSRMVDAEKLEILRNEEGMKTGKDPYDEDYQAGLIDWPPRDPQVYTYGPKGPVLTRPMDVVKDVAEGLMTPGATVLGGALTVAHSLYAMKTQQDRGLLGVLGAPQLTVDPVEQPKEVQEAYRAYKEMVERSKDSPWYSAVLRSFADVATAGPEIVMRGSGLTTTPEQHQDQDYGKRMLARIKGGSELAGGVIGGSAAMAHGLATDTVATGRADVAGAALAGVPLLRGAGALARAAGAGEAMARVGKAIAPVVAPLEPGIRWAKETAAKAEKRTSQGMDSAYDRLVSSESAKRSAQTFADAVEAGEMTVKQATKEMDKRYPLRSAARALDMPAEGSALGKWAATRGKRVLLGMLIGEDYVGALGGAIGGLAIPEAISMVWRRLSPSIRGGIIRGLVDASHQGVAEHEAIARAITEQTRQARAEVSTLFDEAAGIVENKGVDLIIPDSSVEVLAKKQTAPRGATRAERMEFADGELAPPVEAMKTASSIERGASEIARRRSVSRAVEGSGVAAEKFNPLMEAVGTTIEQRKRNAGLVEVGAADRVPFLPDDPVFGEIIDRVQEVVNRFAPKDQRYNRKSVARWLTDPLLEDGLTKLRSAGFRGAVENDLLREHGFVEGTPGWKAAKSVLDDRIAKQMKDALGPTPADTIITLPNGAEVSVGQVIKRVHQQLKETAPDQLRKHQAEAVSKIGQHIAVQVEQRQTAQAYVGELNRWSGHKDRGTRIEDVSTDIAVRTALGEPLLVVPFEPKHQGGMMLADAERIATIASRDSRVAGKGMAVTPEHVRAVGRRLMQMEDIRGRAIPTFIADAIRRNDISKGVDAIWGDPGFLATVDNHAKMLVAAENIDAFFEKVYRHAKTSVTALNLPTHVNNVLANYFYQVVRTGKDPFTLGNEMSAVMERYKGYMGAKSGTRDRRMFRDLSPMIDSDALAGEYAAFMRGDAPGDKVVKVLSKAKGKALKVYRRGDQVFKLHEAVTSYEYFFEELAKVEEGRWISFETGKNEAVHLKRTAKGFEFKGKNIGEDSPQMSKLAAKFGMKRALDIFFDYGDLPTMHGALRSSTPLKVFSAFSPFYSFYWKAIDLPGLKPGLVSHMMDYGPGMGIGTNSPAVLRGRAFNSAMLAVRRSAASALMRSVADVDREILTEMYGQPGQPPSLHLADIGDPVMAKTRSHSAGNMLAATDFVWRAVHRGLASLIGDDEFKEMQGDPSKRTPEQRKRFKLWSARQAGSMVSMDDALQAVGLSGGFIGPVFESSYRAKFLHGDFDIGKAALSVLKLVAGGSVAHSVSVAKDIVMPESSDHWHSQEESWAVGGQPEDFIQWTMKGFISIGERDAFVQSRVPKYLSNMRASMMAGVNKHYDHRTGVARRKGPMDAEAAADAVMSEEERAMITRNVDIAVMEKTIEALKVMRRANQLWYGRPPDEVIAELEAGQATPTAALQAAGIVEKDKPTKEAK